MEKITILGSFVVDLMARADHLPVVGETVKGSGFQLGPGGKGSNQAIAAKRAGADVTFISKIGRDAFADVALNAFKNEKLSTRYIFRDDNYATGAALIMVDENTAHNKILVTSGACNNILTDEVVAATNAIKNSKFFLTQLETNMTAIERGIDIAKQHGVAVILNPAPVQGISDELYKKIDIFTPNEVEASILSEVEISDVADAERAAKLFLAKGVGSVVITLGAKGALVVTPERTEVIPAMPVDVVDTTGAGDAFNGGLVAALAEGMDIFVAARFAGVVGSLSVTKIGTAPAMPYRSEIDLCLTA